MLDNKKEELPLSKTKKKKQNLDITKKTQGLAKLSAKQISQLDYPDEIKKELLKVSKIKSFSARNRHIKYISGLIRNLEQD
jgi:ribosomal 50S subunit-associated protein YjgA (DUF615 family)